MGVGPRCELAGPDLFFMTRVAPMSLVPRAAERQPVAHGRASPSAQRSVGNSMPVLRFLRLSSSDSPRMDGFFLSPVGLVSLALYQMRRPILPAQTLGWLTFRLMTLQKAVTSRSSVTW
jgi:hypothetical protein